MIIRPLTPEDMTEHAKVSSSAFIWPVDWEKEAAETHNYRLLGAFCADNKTLMADLEIYAFESYFCGALLQACGIGGVASRPEYRRKGAMRELFCHLFAAAPENNWHISLLYPFSHGYFRQFGYSLLTKHLRLSVDFSKLSHIPRCYDVKLYAKERLEDLLSVYHAYAKRMNVMVKRKSEAGLYTQAFEKNEYTYLWYDENGTCGSYASYTVDRSASAVNVKEIIFTSKESLLGILGFLRTYDGNIQTLRFSALPASSPLPEIIGEFNALDCRLIPGVAGRILDLKTVLERNAYPNERGAFRLFSRDDVPANAGIFEVEYEKGKASVTRKSQGDYDIAVTPAAASRILLSGEGFTPQSASFLTGAEFAESPNTADFFAAFPRRETDIYEAF